MKARRLDTRSILQFGIRRTTRAAKDERVYNKETLKVINNLSEDKIMNFCRPSHNFLLLFFVVVVFYVDSYRYIRS